MLLFSLANLDFNQIILTFDPNSFIKEFVYFCVLKYFLKKLKFSYFKLIFYCFQIVLMCWYQFFLNKKNIISIDLKKKIWKEFLP